MSLASIRQSALSLPLQERAALIDQLLDSIHLETDPEDRAAIEQQWAEESEQRIDAIDRGELHTLDGPAAIAQLRRSIQK